MMHAPVHSYAKGGMWGENLLNHFKVYSATVSLSFTETYFVLRRFYIVTATTL